ncbi:hypothetical protein [Georgenia sp. AZ-5]|uniref:hypothetical protein n=1 Tax=Georgenia sp. AZ-5 TaxID=3367526 RepID=UPI003754BD96
MVVARETHASRQVRRRAAALRAGAVLLLGLGGLAVWQAAPGADVTAPAASPVNPLAGTLPAAPQPWTGEATGCTVPDPSGTGGCVAGVTAWAVDQLTAAVGEQPMTCWSEHAWNPSSDHPRGLGCDIFVGAAGQFPAGDHLAHGWRMAEWLRVHAADLGVHYLIWQGQIWVADRAGAGWVPYDGGGVYDPGDATGGHFDHVHVSLRG